MALDGQQSSAARREARPRGLEAEAEPPIVTNNTDHLNRADAQVAQASSLRKLAAAGSNRALTNPAAARSRYFESPGYRARTERVQDIYFDNLSTLFIKRTIRRAKTDCPKFDDDIMAIVRFPNRGRFRDCNAPILRRKKGEMCVRLVENHDVLWTGCPYGEARRDVFAELPRVHVFAAFSALRSGRVFKRFRKYASE
jgi:hypothetical protein